MDEIKLYLRNNIRFKKDILPPEGIALLEERLTFRNPLYFKNEKWGKLNTPNIKPTLKAIWYDEEQNEVVIARGYLNELIRILQANRYTPEVIDEARRFTEMNFPSDLLTEGRGIIWPCQGEALEEISKHRFGVLIGPLNSGKKMLACKLAARRKVPVLVIVRTVRELYQWRETAKQYLNLKENKIGLIGDGSKDIGMPFTIAITLSLYKMIDQVEPLTGFVIIDQCEVMNLKVFFKVAQFNCPYVLGLANSSKRSDGLTKFMEALIGQRIYNIVSQGEYAVVKPVLKIQDTGFVYDFKDDWPEMVAALCNDEMRNKLIVTDILQAISNPLTKALVISERVKHLEDIRTRIEQAYGQAEIITGDTPEEKRQEIYRRFEMGKLQVVLVTFKSVSSIEIKKVNHLFFISPVKFFDSLSQVVSMVFKTEANNYDRVIFDYRDNVEQLKNSLKKRLRVYQTISTTF